MRTKLPLAVGAILFIAILARLGHTDKTSSVASHMTLSAKALVDTLDEPQKHKTLYPIDSPKLVGWHFIPKDERKGLELNDMNGAQREAAQKLLASVLSKAGYTKATKIMELETLLKELQDKHGGRGPIRDPLRYYFTVFGAPSTSDRWALSIEGHHLSLNFVVQGEQVVSSTPQFFATNPATVKSRNRAGIALGTRLLRLEETLAFELVNTLAPGQRKVAIIAEQAPREIRAAGEPQPPQDEPAGIAWRRLTVEQRRLLRRLIYTYLQAMPPSIRDARLDAIKQEGGFKTVHFAWAGSLQTGVGHYYRVQGTTFLIEFVNTQPDSDGNPANHIHCVWRDMHGDFGIAIAAK